MVGKVAGLAAGVGELDACFLPLGVDEIHDSLHALDLAVVPEPDVAGGDAAVCRDGAGFEDDQGGTAEGIRSEMHEVEVGHEPVLGRVHPHGRDGETVV